MPLEATLTDLISEFWPCSCSRLGPGSVKLSRLDGSILILEDVACSSVNLSSEMSGSHTYQWTYSSPSSNSPEIESHSPSPTRQLGTLGRKLLKRQGLIP